MAERKNSEKRIATNNRWTNAHYDRINLAVPLGQKDEIKALADMQGQSVNAYIISAINERVNRDNGGPAAPVERALTEKPAESPQEAAGAAQEGGVVSLPSDTLEAAQQAAEAAGEGLEDFVRRAINETIERDAEGIRKW